LAATWDGCCWAAGRTDGTERAEEEKERGEEEEGEEDEEGKG
jgi:hypothetical protein